ncbi:hypothetical protein LFL96_35200 (plasmid) [Paraburkholderia sp. D15]|uniref:hypothetical protein n=1 Tax=Paraburkholderia sp. D15 TaxID=2880218 RepID=UPI00247A5D85|nr:hypothetical protein [Paraburkholderia sp. D15]WGS55189.1 hypothetical protein LFL96_35200 [Paraburkholderia sp. D15]
MFEAIACVMRCADRSNTVGEAVAQEDTLTAFPILRTVDAEMTPLEFARSAASAFFLWPKALLDEHLNRRLLANLVQHDLFSGNQSGWDAYVAERRQQVPWFGETLDKVSEPHLGPGNAGRPPSGY